MRFFGDYWQNFGELIGRSAAAGGGVVAPVITTDAVIGVELDAGAGYSTYQWQSSSDGATWADISGATAQTYTPDDAVFGLYLRVKGDGAASNATGRAAEVPEQTLGAELLSNGDFSAWTDDNPSGFGVVLESGSDPMVTQVAPDGSPGTGAARLYSSTTAFAPRLQAGILTTGGFYETVTDVTVRTAGSILVSDSSVAGLGLYALNSTGRKRQLGRATGTTFDLRGNNPAPTDVVVDKVSLKKLTLNAQLTAPSADIRLTAFYELPASPVQGDQVWVTSRVPEGEDFFVNGNGWLVLLEYTGSQWNITVYSVASHTRVSRITASNIGATDGIRVTMNGAAISLETTADGGDNWTSRGTPATNATYQTATGVNMAHTSTVTPATLEYEPAV